MAAICSIDDYKIDVEDREFLEKIDWVIRDGYQGVPYGRMKDGKVMAMHRFILTQLYAVEIPKNYEIYFIDGDVKNMRRVNLDIRPWTGKFNL